MSNRWSWTWNNYTQDDEYYLADMVLQKTVKFAIWGYEVGEQGTPHLQGYIEFKKRISFELVRKKFRNNHIEPARSDKAANIKYCTKDWTNECVFVHGDIATKQGSRNDIKAVKDMLDNGKRLEDVCKEYPEVLCKYPNGIKMLNVYSQKPRTQPPRVVYIHGPPGAGKTRLAMTYSSDIYTVDNPKFWDGYEQQHVVLFDDIKKPFLKDFTFTQLLRVCDRYPCRVNIKGGSAIFNSPIIVFTADRSIESLFDHYEQIDIDQFKRRITDIIELKI